MGDWIDDWMKKPRQERRKKKYRSIDDPWEDSSEVKPFNKPKIKPAFAKARVLKPVERYYFNAIMRDENGSMGNEPVLFSVGPTLHKMMMEAMIGKS